MTDSATQTIRTLAGRYEVGRLLGRGGMADVHLGIDTRLRRRVAIKLLKPTLATDPLFRTRFRQEAQAAARMAHPTIVRVFDAGEETVRDDAGDEMQVPFIVMEHVDGRLLRDVIAEGPLEPTEAARIIGAVLTALEYSHRAGVVHRDIKPGNIMITASGQVKVMDFGIARAIAESSATVVQTSAIVGTAQYFSPEQARGESVDARSDLYSSGVVLFELLTGRPLFRGDTPVAVAYKHLTEQPARPSTVNPSVPHALDLVVLHSLSKSRDERYQTAADFRADVERAIAGQIPVPKRPKPAPTLEAAIFGVSPTPGAAADATFRQLTVDEDERVVRTQTRPPVSWIWAGIVMTAVVLAAVVFWVATLPPPRVELATSVAVPTVTGMPWADAEAALLDAGLNPHQTTESSPTVPEGHVTRTEPDGEAGDRVPPGQDVQVWVSTGPRAVAMPALEGKPEAQARAELEAAGLVPGQSVRENSATVPGGHVIRSTPVDATVVEGTLPEATRVDLVLSSGLVTVPDVRGLPAGEAGAALEQARLPVSLAFNPGCSGGVVSWQSLTPGEHQQGSPITIEVCSG